MKKSLLFFFVLIFQLNYSQTIKIGLLTDKNSPEVKPLLEQLKTEIRAVLGQGKTVNFKNVLSNNYNLETAKANYESLVNSDADIILAFGVMDNIVLSQQESYTKPVIVFGSINSDFINLPREQKTSGINNITYIIAPLSYKKDLNAFKTIYNYKNIGIIIDDYIIDALPLETVFNPYFQKEGKQYRLIPLSENGLSASDLDGIDAVYLAGGFDFSNAQFEELTSMINTKKLPSFSANRVKDVERGILATNQPQTNLDQFFRRIALNVEAIVNGTNASELPLLLEYKNKLTINYETAKRIDFPLRYAMLGSADFIGGSTKPKTENSLSILDIMRGVLDQNLGLSSNKKSIELSSQDVKIAKSGYLPNVTAGVSGVYLDPRVAEISNGSNPEISTSGNVVLEQLIYSESASANIDIKEDLQKAQEAVYNASELDALLNASVAYFNALILKTNTNIQNQNLQITKRNLELAEQNFEGGASGKSDVLRFRSQLAQNTQNLIDAGNQLRQAYFTINQLMNSPINKDIDINDAMLSEGVFENYKYEDFYTILDDPKLQPALIEFLVKEGKKNAPELKNINYNLSANDRTYRLNDTGRFIPTVALQGQYNLAISQSGKGSTVPDGFPVTPDGTYNFGLNVSLPIFNQNQRNINRQTAKIQEEQLGYEKENIELNIEKNVNDIVLDLISEIANIEISKVSEETAKESLELTQNAYKQGAVPVIQLIDAQTNYLQTQLASATANYNYLLTSMQLERAIGYFFLVHTEAENQQFIQSVNQYILSKN
ncbi:TolC family protein [Flavivirga spongiicola]|uniref:TolC family protein n=1 Tax=Flavivirga spongiicola TaxID=421621 RepID=A0ABU7XUS9_9FLAO|nr:TolC family protein [Flavivirga sp. MEBiC05379]MDO5979537.1 TolC family protein [Flavivirga sp. MEBiC05379]